MTISASCHAFPAPFVISSKTFADSFPEPVEESGFATTFVEVNPVLVTVGAAPSKPSMISAVIPQGLQFGPPQSIPVSSWF